MLGFSVSSDIKIDKCSDAFVLKKVHVKESFYSSLRNTQCQLIVPKELADAELIVLEFERKEINDGFMSSKNNELFFLNNNGNEICLRVQSPVTEEGEAINYDVADMLTACARTNSGANYTIVVGGKTNDV